MAAAATTKTPEGKVQIYHEEVPIENVEAYSVSETAPHELVFMDENGEQLAAYNWDHVLCVTPKPLVTPVSKDDLTIGGPLGGQ